MRNSPRIALTVDVECIHREDPSGLPEWLHLFDRLGVKATFFVTGDILCRFEPQVRDALAAGHEVASHGANHPAFTEPGAIERRLPTLSDKDLEEEIRRSREEFLERGIQVKGFRAVAFRTDARVLAAVARHFVYDSSLPGRSGPFPLAEGILEIPVTHLGWKALRLGTPQMALLGERTLSSFLWWGRARTPWVFYGHSFDLIRMSGPFYTSYLKRLGYYERTGPRMKVLIERFLCRMSAWGAEFVRCEDILKEFRVESNKVLVPSFEEPQE